MSSHDTVSTGDVDPAPAPVNRTIAALSLALASGTALGEVEIDLSDADQCRFGAYTLVERIGGGGMGVVYRAHQQSLERDVAIKLLNLRLDDDENVLARFQFEARSAAALNHPNIVQVLEIGQQQGIAYIAMQLVRGQSLAERIASERFAAKPAVDLMLRLCDAVGYAHRLHLLHLDLKPANILLDERGEPLVADFGLARRMDDHGQVQAQEVSGTPAYMAPEQVLIKQYRLSAATDLYALGAILYEMLCGVPPHGRGDPAEVMQRALAGQIPPPHQLAPKLPRDLEAITMKCLSLRAADRYASVEALAEDLRRYANGLGVSVRPLNMAQRLGRWTRRDPRLATAMALIVVALIAGITATSWQWQRADMTARRLTESNRHLTSIVHMMAMIETGTPFTREEIPDAAAVIQAQFHDNPGAEVDMLTQLGLEASIANDPKDARSILQAAERIARTRLDPQVAEPRLAMLALRQGDAAQRAGDPRRAETYLRTWLASVSKKYGADSIDYAHWASHLAFPLLDQERFSEAESLARSSASILRTKWGAEKDWTLLAEYALGRALLAQGHPADAVPLLRHAGDGWEKMYADRPAIQVYARYYQGIAMAAAGDHDAGDQLARTSVSESRLMDPSPDLMGQPLADALARASAVLPPAHH